VSVFAAVEVLQPCHLKKAPAHVDCSWAGFLRIPARNTYHLTPAHFIWRLKFVKTLKLINVPGPVNSHPLLSFLSLSVL